MEALLVVLLPLSYLIGALPLGQWIVARLAGQDVRTASAYNLGLESAIKRVGAGPLLLAFFADFLKGYVGVYLLKGFGLPWTLLAAVLVYLGHLYPLPFKGNRPPLRARGAGVLIGALAGLSVAGLGYVPTFLALVVGLAVYAATGYAALAALSIPLALAILVTDAPHDPWTKALAWALFLVALWRYKENLGRILEGTEPKLGKPLPLPDEKTAVCAFFVHPLTLEDFWQSPRFRWLRPLVKAGVIPERWVEKLAERFRPMKVGEIRGARTADGREIRCYLISAPLLPHQIVNKPELATQKAIQAARLAEELGAEVIGLGAYWSVVGEKGRRVQEMVPTIQVTNGGALTAGTVKAAIPRIIARFRREGKDPKEATAAVVGATGVVAFGIARQIAPLFGRLILIGRDPERTQRVAKSLKRNLEKKGHATEVVATTDYAPLKEADLIFSATSQPEPVILPEHVKPGTWIYDEGVPPDVHPGVKKIPGVRVIPGGVVRLPGEAKSTLDLHFGGPDLVPACLAETMILAAERAFENKSLGGEVKNENVQYFVERAEALGFEVLDG